MNTPASEDHTGSAGLLDDGQRRLIRPYSGGRAQAESGSKIIENDYDAWKAVCVRPYRLAADHPMLQQFLLAWRAVSALGLGDDPGAASVRYRVLAHAARSLAPDAGHAGHGRETDALLNLFRHARIHGLRLYATDLDQFFNSGASGRYTSFAEAAAGSAIVEKYYLAWEEALGGELAATAIGLAEDILFLRNAWAYIAEHGLADGPGPGRSDIARSQTVPGPSPMTSRSDCRPLRSLRSWSWQCTQTSTRSACTTPPLPSKAVPTNS
jgi:hypothetical protein